MLSLSAGVSLAQEIRGARFLALPDTGHVPEEETPEEFAKAVSEFLGSAARDSETPSVAAVPGPLR
jgi:pimeloyl-ACP methyl ester carboxylesterase